MPSTFDEPVLMRGGLTIVGDFIVPNNSITNEKVASSTVIAATKLAHRHYARVSVAGTVATATFPIHEAYAAGSIVQLVVASIVVAIGAATVTVDLRKNGTTVLSSVVTLNSSSVARTPVAGTVSSASYTSGDFFEVVITATASGGTLPSGLLVQMIVDENPA
jgi:hypothetical protein